MSITEKEKIDRRKYIKYVGGIVGATAVAAAAGYYYYSSTRPGPGSIKIGFVGPLSAPGSYVAGTEMKHAAELAVEDINAEGGLLGRKVELIVEDTQGTPDKGVSAFEKMITLDKVVAITGEFHSSVAAAEIEIARKYGVPFVIADAGADKLCGAGYKEIFRVGTQHSAYAITTANMLEKLRNEGKISRVVGIPDDTEGGQTVWKYLRIQLDKLKPPIPYSEHTVELATKDFVPLLLKLKEEKPRADVVWSCIASPNQFLLIKQAVETGLWPTPETPLFLDNGSAPEIGVESFWETVGKAGIGVVSITYWSPRIKLNPEGEYFTKKMIEKTGVAPTSAAFEEYDCMLALFDAIKRAGSTEPDKIIAALETCNVRGTRFNIKFETIEAPEYTLKHQVRRECVYVQWDTVGQGIDTARVVWPPEYATHELMWPPFPGS